MTWPFEPLKMFGYDVIVADPPWDFRVWSATGEKKGARHHYCTMRFADIAALPVGQLARGDCLLLLWACGCMLPQAIEAMTAWGFVFKSEIVWRKQTRAGKVPIGLGYRVRNMHEPILVGTIGSPAHKPFPSLVNGIRRTHSRKPDEFYALVRKHTPRWRRADLFSRESREGFAGWGHEHGKFDREPA